jgi:2-[(L-alanin-3-ylcarbamoyl)methyl]-2-hydroxybutanedioate decarboxylase
MHSCREITVQLAPRMPSYRVGDILLFSYAGAYGWAISHHDFLSHPHPEHLYIESDSINYGHESLDARQ